MPIPTALALASAPTEHLPATDHRPPPRVIVAGRPIRHLHLGDDRRVPPPNPPSTAELRRLLTAVTEVISGRRPATQLEALLPIGDRRALEQWAKTGLAGPPPQPHRPDHPGGASGISGASGDSAYGPNGGGEVGIDEPSSGRPTRGRAMSELRSTGQPGAARHMADRLGTDPRDTDRRGAEIRGLEHCGADHRAGPSAPHLAAPRRSSSGGSALRGWAPNQAAAGPGSAIPAAAGARGASAVAREQRSRMPCQLRSVHASRTSVDTVDVVARVEQGGRSRAVVGRVEYRSGRWRFTLLTLF